MKKCSYCKEEKPRSEFYKRSLSKDGLAYVCKECSKTYQQEQYKRNTEQHEGLYAVWACMIQRCTNEKATGYKTYGGRGIKVCTEWLNSQVFIEWAESNGYKRGLQIDRINNNGHYCPSNCRFVTQAINSRNKTNTRLTIEQVREMRERYANGGITQKELAAHYGVSKRHVNGILNNEAWKEVTND